MGVIGGSDGPTVVFISSSLDKFSIFLFLFILLIALIIIFVFYKNRK